jgi:osmoprotectant transport system ATP-binding protein
MIEFRSVSKRYPDGTVAVRDFSLTIAAHEVVVLVGSSGPGKTTLLRMVNRMTDPTSGQVLIDGEDVAAQKAVTLRRRIGYVMQNTGLMPHFTIAENIATVPRLTGRTRRESRSRALDLMTTVGLDPAVADRYPGQLSGGQAQRVGVARALAAEPNILLMDEPFGAVDPIVRADLQRELIRLQQELDKTVVFVTHDIDEAFLLGDRIVILENEGVVAQAGTPNEIIETPANDFVAALTGTTDGSRSLRIRRTATAAVVVDASGRTRGVLDEDDLR